jgi:hypothetical protein
MIVNNVPYYGAQIFVHIFENACSYVMIEDGLFGFLCQDTKTFLKTKERDLKGRSFVVSQKDDPGLRPERIGKEMGTCP